MAATDQPRRVLFMDHTAALGGGEVALLNVLLALDRRRYEPVVLLFGDGPLRPKLEAAGIETRVLALDASVAEARKDTLGGGSLLKVKAAWQAVRFVLALRKAVRQSGAVLVHTNSLKSDLLGGIAARLALRPVVWHIRDRIADDYLPARVVKMMRLLVRWVPTAIAVNSHATGLTLLPDDPGALDRPGHVGNRLLWVVHDGTPMLPDVRPASDPPVVGLVGRVTPWKGQHVFIDAIARVYRQFPGVRFRIIGKALFGEDDYERQIHASVSELGLGEVVEFTGFRSDVEAAIGELDLLVHASTTGEPFGQVIIEGMAAGKAVIATRGGGVSEILVDGATGRLVPMGDAAALAAAMQDLLADPQRRAEMGRLGRQRVIDHFSMARVAGDLQAVFDAVLTSTDTPIPAPRPA